MLKYFFLFLNTLIFAAGLNELAFGDGRWQDNIPLSETVTRQLQNNVGDAGALDVGLICAGYMKDGDRECECERYKAEGVTVKCTDINQRCTSDGYMCTSISFTTAILPLTAFEQVSEYTITCSNFIFPNRTYETCVDIEPDQPGLYNETVRCGASLDGNRCESCSQCSNTPYTTVSVDCQNLEENAKQTCGNVTDIGFSVLAFDEGYDPLAHSGVASMGSLFSIISVALLSSVTYMVIA